MNKLSHILKKVKALLREALEKLNVVPQQFESNKE
jgi:hypothetical protein